MKILSLFNAVNTSDMEAVAIEVLRSSRIANGTYTVDFEQGLENLLDQKYIVTTVDMTSAIHLALYLAGVKAGDDVLTTAFACMSTNSPIATIGARPIWVDIAKDSAFIDLNDFEASITPKTKAAIVYHLAGYPAPIQEISNICIKHNIVLIEDCNNALLASVNGKNVGNFGDYAVYSFYPNRQINTSEGGALVCKNLDHAIRAKKLRRFGIDTLLFRSTSGEINPTCNISEAGWSISLNNLCSGLGYTQLKTVLNNIEKTRINASILINALIFNPAIKILKSSDFSISSYWALLIKVKNRDAVLAALKKEGVMASILHQRNDVYSCFIESVKSLPNTLELQNEVIAIPCGWWLSFSDLNKIAETLTNAVKKQN
jgi:perosamine synthetase